MKTLVLAIVPMVLLEQRALSAHAYLEKYYQAKRCPGNNWESEVALLDQARVDFITSTHVIEMIWQGMSRKSWSGKLKFATG